MSDKISEMKKYFVDKKVLFMTNTTTLPCSTFVASLKTYIDYIPIHNFWICNGVQNNKSFYGVDVFMEMIARAFSERIFKKFDYVVYIDSDCFICDFEALYEQIKLFVDNDEYCIAGPQDGGVFSHRNHSRKMINTFLSFWNVKKLRDSVTPQQYIDNVNKVSTEKENGLIAFNRELSKSPALFDYIEELSVAKNKQMREYRDNHYKNEYHKSFSCDEMNGSRSNYEPYYIVEQAYVLSTGLPIMYFSATDYYNSEMNDDETDNSGMTSVVLSDDMKKTIALHTWFGSMYSIHPVTEEQLVQSKRINKVIKQIIKD